MDEYYLLSLNKKVKRHQSQNLRVVIVVDNFTKYFLLNSLLTQ